MNRLGAYRKKADNVENMQARYSMLTTGLKSPNSVSTVMAKSLGGQRAFAALSLKDTKHIRKISLNTMKSLADELYPNIDDNDKKGFAHFDSLRNQLNSIMEGQVGARTLEAKANRLSEASDQQKRKLQEVEFQHTFTLKAYLEICKNLNAFIKDETLPEDVRKRLANLLDDHRAMYRSLFSPISSITPGSTGTVLKIIPSTKDCK